jgi:hypothetical protein
MPAELAFLLLHSSAAVIGILVISMPSLGTVAQQSPQALTDRSSGMRVCDCARLQRDGPSGGIVVGRSGLTGKKGIIIVDDGSTDGTREKLRALPPSNDITIVFHEKNCGKRAPPLPVFRRNAYPGRAKESGPRIAILQHPDPLVSQGVRVLFSFRMLLSSADSTIQMQGVKPSRRQRDATGYRTPAMFVFRVLMSAPRAVCAGIPI